MKKFKFKLEGVVKLREFKEYRAKVELGRINMEMGKIRQRIEDLNTSIHSTFDLQNEYLRTPTNANMLKSFSMNVVGARALIKKLEIQLDSMMEEYEKRRQDLLLARADLKLICKLKEEKHRKFKFENDKKLNHDIQEIHQSRMSQQAIVAAEEDKGH